MNAWKFKFLLHNIFGTQRYVNMGTIFLPRELRTCPPLPYSANGICKLKLVTRKYIPTLLSYNKGKRSLWSIKKLNLYLLGQIEVSFSVVVSNVRFILRKNK